MTIADILRCPICLLATRTGEPDSNTSQDAALTAQEGCFTCAQGHSFDRAKQGYLNLLLPQHKRSKEPGDSKAMVQSRRSFLEQGFYAPLATALAELLTEYLPQTTAVNRVLDAGCGEGYYVRALADQVRQVDWYANDISKWAVRAAAPWHRQGTYMVASNARLPLADDSLAAIVCAFGFAADEEFKRVLAPHGVLLMLDPGPHHLIELREVLYGEQLVVREGDPAVREGWHCLAQRSCRYSIQLPNAEVIQSLIAMTPHQHKASRQGLSRLAQLQQLQVTVDATLRVYQQPMAEVAQCPEKEN